MGLLNDLTSLTVASISREWLDPLAARLGQAESVVRRHLRERFMEEGEGLKLQLRTSVDRAWRALETLLAGEELLQKAASASPEEARVAELLKRFLACLPREAPALGEPAARSRSLLELRQARQSGLLLADPIEEASLEATVVGLVAQPDQARHDRLTAEVLSQMASTLAQAGYSSLASLMRPGPGAASSPFVVRAAVFFFRQEVNRNPIPFKGLVTWPASSMAQEGEMPAIEQILLQSDGLLERWLGEVGEPLPPLPPLAPGSTVRQPPSLASLPPPPQAPAAAPAMPRRRATPEMDVDDEEDRLGKERRKSKVAAPAGTTSRPKHEETQSGAVLTGPVVSAVELRRRATVRWYRRMNPERMYPLLVVLSRGRIQEVSVAGVGQAAGKEVLQVPAGHPFVLVKPVLPGCQCYPPEQVVDVTPDTVEVRFRVLPQILGRVEDSRVELYWRERLLDSIPLDISVSRQTLAVALSLGGFLWPFLGTGARAVGVDAADSRDVVLQALNYLLRLPHAIEGGVAGLLAVALAAWWWNRPRAGQTEVDVLQVRPMALEQLLDAGKLALSKEHWEEARGFFEDAANLAPDAPAVRAYLEASRLHLPGTAPGSLPVRAGGAKP